MNIDNSMALNAYNAVNDKLITQNRPRFDEKALESKLMLWIFLVKPFLILSIKNENPLFSKDLWRQDL